MTEKLLNFAANVQSSFKAEVSRSRSLERGTPLDRSRTRQSLATVIHGASKTVMNKMLRLSSMLLGFCSLFVSVLHPSIFCHLLAVSLFSGGSHGVKYPEVSLRVLIFPIPTDSGSSGDTARGSPAARVGGSFYRRWS